MRPLVVALGILCSQALTGTMATVRAEGTLRVEVRSAASGAPGGTPGWTVVNLTAGMRIGQNLLLSGGLANLFDEAYRIHGSGIDGPGRHAWLSARFEF